MMSSILRCLRRPAPPSSGLRPQFPNNPQSRTLRTRPRQSLLKQRTLRRAEYAPETRDPSKNSESTALFTGGCMVVLMWASAMLISPKVAEAMFIRYVSPFFEIPYIQSIEKYEERISTTERRVGRIAEVLGVLGTMTDDVAWIEMEANQLKWPGWNCDWPGKKEIGRRIGRNEGRSVVGETGREDGG